MKAKKHLGQHFLTSKAALRDMIEAASVKKDDIILEIGPGKGVLTRALLDTGAKVVSVETDVDMLNILKDEFSLEIGEGRLILLDADILNVRLNKTSLKDEVPSILDGYKVVANIPYYITGEILRRFLTAEVQPTSMTILVQKEVAQRIAKSKKETVLSLSVKAYGHPRYISTVPARYFSPPPKVDSAVLHISEISKTFFKDLSEERFFKVVKAGFSSKRKKLVNNLSSFGSKDELAQTLNSLGLHENLRAEDIGLEEWRKLTEELE